jgi:hypothetical protein
MSKPIPEELRRRVWKHYLNGKSFGMIFRLTGVIRASVYNIVHNIEKEDPNYPLFRAIALDLKKNGSDLQHYSSYLRISQLLAQHGIDYPTGEAILSELLPACYQLRMEPSEAINTLRNFSNSAEEYGHSLEQHAEYFNKLHARVEQMHLELGEEGKKLHDLIQKNPIVQDNLDVFLSEDGVLAWIENNKLTTVENEYEIKELKKDLALFQSGNSVDSHELNKLNDSLVSPVSEAEVVAKLEDIRRNPSMYSHLFAKRLPSDSDKMARSLSLPQTESTINASPPKDDSSNPPRNDMPETSIN